jgi:hypothetical protein
MRDQYPELSVGGYLRGDDGQLLLGAHFYHPDAGVGYVGEDGTFTYTVSEGGYNSQLRGVIVHFDDQEEVPDITRIYAD